VVHSRYFFGNAALRRLTGGVAPRIGYSLQKKLRALWVVQRNSFQAKAAGRNLFRG
jgi:hypothetical protein